jgi:hypothetical protein
LLDLLQKDLAYFQGSRHWLNEIGFHEKAAGIESFFIEQGSGPRELVLRVGSEARVLELPRLASTLDSERGRKWATEIALREWSR